LIVQPWARIDTWSGTDDDDELNRIDVALANLPSSTVKAGYQFTFFNDGTAENGNLVFGRLPQTANQVITRSFQATTAGSEPESREVTAGRPAPQTRALPPREPAPAPRTRALPARA
jgi:hypothetical protein